MRIAFFSPLPPQTSGIADYSAELLPLLAREVELEAFTAAEAAAAPPAAHAVYPYGDFPRRARQQPFDAVVYQMGNSAPFHREIRARALQTPGILVLHESMLHHLVREITLGSGDLEGYVEELRYCCGATGWRAGRRLVDSGIPVNMWDFPLFERVVDTARGVIVLNRTTERRVLQSRPRARIRVVPHHFVLPDLATDEAARQVRHSLGLEAGTPLVGSFGFITSQKRLEVALGAFRRVRSELPKARFLLVGEVSCYYDLAARLAGEQGRGVIATGRVELEELLRMMAAVDVAINLRYPSGGETSGTLMRLFALGKPVIVSRLGFFDEVPEGCCAKVELDAQEEPLVETLLRSLLTDPGLRQAMGDNARRYVETHHRLEDEADGYLRCIEEVVAGDAWPEPAVPPLAPYPAHDFPSSLAAEVARALVDLGLGEEHEELLGSLARDLVELGLDR